MIVKVEYWKLNGEGMVPQQRIYSDVQDCEFFPHEWALTLGENLYSNIVGISLDEEGSVGLLADITMGVDHYLYDVSFALLEMERQGTNYVKLKHVVLHYKNGTTKDFVTTNSSSVFIMNDEGKTIDKLL